MDNGGVNLDNKFAALGLNDLNDGNDNNLSQSTSSNDGLSQVMTAVLAAEATIKQQIEENVRLKGELEMKIQELDRYKTAAQKAQIHNQVDHLVDSAQEPRRDNEIVSDFGNLVNEENGSNHNSSRAISDTNILLKDLVGNNKGVVMQRHTSSHSEVNEGNDNLNAVFSAQASVGNPGLVQLSPPAMTSFSPTRYQTLGEFNPDGGLSGRGLMTLNNFGSLNQDLALKIRDHEEEILRLRHHVAEYSAKEAQIQNEKYILEKRIAYMRMAFDQQQQDLVDATSKAISYRQDIMEENIRLTYALQAAQQERSTFISSLVPLLTEYSFEPPVPDAQSIASNLKVLFRHMQEKLLVTEAKLKESQYQLAPLLSDVYPSNISSSPSHYFGMKNGLELVAQPSYSNADNPLSSDIPSSPDWGLLGHHQSGTVSGVKNAEADDLGGYSPIASRGASMQNLQMHAVSQAELHSRIKDETSSKQVKFKDLVSSEMEESDPSRGQNDRVPPVSRTSRNTAYTAAVEDPNTSFSPYLTPVLEEPSSSFSEDEDPLPAIEGLQISGEAFPGRILLASGYSINGTTSCNFEWVRHLEDGSFNYIEGAKQPNYLVTADDVDTYLAIEVQPLDNRKRKGELVKVFANEHTKIGCDPEVQTSIEKALYVGHTSFKVSLSPSAGYLGIWEPAKLGIKRDGYSIKCSRPSGVLVSEKFTSSTIISVRYGSPTEFSIIGSEGNEHLLRAENVNDMSCSRDTIVLTLRIFLVRASEKKKGKKRGLFSRQKLLGN